MRCHRRTDGYLVAHLLDAGNTASRQRSCKFLFFGRNLAGKKNCAVSNVDFDASYRPVVNGLEYFEFQFFRCHRRIGEEGLILLSLFPSLSRHRRLIGRCCAALRFKIAYFVGRCWQPACVVFYFRTSYIVLLWIRTRYLRCLLGGRWDMRLFSRNSLLRKGVCDGLRGWLRLGPNEVFQAPADKIINIASQSDK